MSNMTVQGFVDYVNSQSPDKPIDHNSWGDCVIGDYAQHVDPHLEGMALEYKADEFANGILAEVAYSPGMFVMFHMLTGYHPTYGGRTISNLFGNGGRYPFMSTYSGAQYLVKHFIF